MKLVNEESLPEMNNDQIEEPIQPTSEAGLTVLVEEYRMVSSEVVMYMTELMKVPVLIVAAIAFVFGIKGSEGFSDFARVLGVPVFAGLIFYVAFLCYAVARNGRYRAVIEREINEILGDTYLRWNSQVTKKLEWYNDKRGLRKLTFLLHPMYFAALFGVMAVIAIVVLLMIGKITPAQLWGRSSIFWMTGLMLAALFSLIYVVTAGRSSLEKNIDELYQPRRRKTDSRPQSRAVSEVHRTK
jgi:hypothetical protein